MRIAKDSARLPNTGWIGRIGGVAALAVALAIAASPAAAVAKKKHQATNTFAGNGVVDSTGAPAAACGATFSSCCTISSGGMYTMSADISTAITSGTCVSISTSAVTINLAGFTITDTKSGNTATGISMTGTTNDYLEGANGTVTGFATGVSVNPGSSFGTRNAYVDSLNVSSNTAAGILAAGNNVSISSISAGSNLNGVEFDVCAGCSLNFGDIENNTAYGIWVNDSTNTAIGGIFTASNTSAGIYVGCNSTPGSGSCGGTHGNNTKIFNGLTDSNTYGVYIEEGETANNVAYTDGSSNTTDDAFARNDATCSNTNWFENVFGTASPACIPL